MTIRGKRFLIAMGLICLAGIALLIALEWRRRQAAAADSPFLDGSGSAVTASELEERYRDPEVFRRLCADVTERLDAVQQRFLRLRHTRKTLVTRYNSAGEPDAVTETIYRVHFDNGVERKKEMSRRQLLGKPSLLDLDKLKLEPASLQLLLPFSKEVPEGFYRYQLSSIEEIAGRRLLRIQFEPVESVERSFRGSAWIDPATAEPVRLLGSPVKPRLRVDRFEMLSEYGPSENGCIQLRRVTIETSGGFAALSWHFRSETELSDYKDSE